MRNLHRGTLGLLLAGALAATGCAAVAHGPPSGDLAAEIARAERRGKALFEADALAAQGSDALMEELRGPMDRKLRGYLALPAERRVDFLGIAGEDEEGKAPTGQEVVRRYTVAFPAEKEKEKEPAVTVLADEPVTDAEAAMFRALLVAVREAKPFCPRSYNPIAIADPDGPGWLVYVLASTRDPAEVVIGGHIRLRVSADGMKVEENTPLSRTCMVATKEPAEDGRSLVGLVVSHLGGPVPTEAHVYLSLLHGLPLYVVAGDRRWRVEAGKVEPLPD